MQAFERSRALLFVLLFSTAVSPAVFAQKKKAPKVEKTDHATGSAQAQPPKVTLLQNNDTVSLSDGFLKPTNATSSLYVSGHLYSGTQSVPVANLRIGLNNLYSLAPGAGCRKYDPVPKIEHANNEATTAPIVWGVRNNITVPELKFVDQNWVQQKMNATAQAIAGLTAFSAAPITSQFGLNQGVTLQATSLAVQAAPATTSSAAPSAPAAPTTPTLPTAGASPLDVLTQQVELNAQLMMYQGAYSGFTSDNLVINSDGKTTGMRRQVTLAIPVSVSPMMPYKGAVAEVRIVLVPRKGSSGHLSVVNLLPGSNTYNVAEISTDTKQLSAGATLEAVSLGVTAGKQKSALYLQKDMDTVSMQFENPSTQRDRDLSRSFGMRFRNLLPTGECDHTGSGWTALATTEHDYDLDRAILFGWQFRPVLGDENVRSVPRIVLAQIALDNGEDGAPEAFVETRWRQYDKKTGTVGAVYRDSCTWKPLADAAPLSYEPQVLDVHTDDLGGGNVRLKVSGLFFDPNLQVKIGGTQKPIDFRSTDGLTLEILTTATALLNSPNVELIGSYENSVPLAIPLKDPDKCRITPSNLHEFPNSDGTANLTMDIAYGTLMPQGDITAPILLLGSTAYGLRDHPYLSWSTSKDSAGSINGTITMSAKSDDLKAVPSALLRDMDWNTSTTAVALLRDPTFSGLATVGAATLSDPKKLTKGWYTLTGADLGQIGNIDCADQAKPCASIVNTADPSNDVKLTNKSLRVISPSSVLLNLESDASNPMTLIWKDGSWSSAWSLSVKSDATDSKPSADPAQLQKGDSRVVHFAGQDFSAVTTIAFEDSTLLITSRDPDNKGISVLVPTKATATPGVKQLVANKPTGDPIILTVTVVIP